MPSHQGHRASGSFGPDYFINSSMDRRRSFSGFFDTEEMDTVSDWFRSLDAFSPTPLRSLPRYAREIGVGELMVKDESCRMRSNAFKISGVSYAIQRLINSGEIRMGSILACATDGNHGWAVAHVAHQHRLLSRIFIHKGASRSRIRSIEAECAQVIIVDGTYDDSVKQAAREAERNGWFLISDTAWPGYEIVPHHIMAGYTILMTEAAQQWEKPPDLVLVQAGVGALAGSVVGWFHEMLGENRPQIVSCEPDNAACVLASMCLGAPVVLDGALRTIMAGLSCGTVSSVAWPALIAGLDACVTVTDEECANAVRNLAHPQPDDPFIISGESGACGVAALIAIMNRDGFRPVRDALGLNSESRVMVINTEGATDPDSYEALTGIRVTDSAGK
jgi:diaminopropionate ammonia-lyase